MASDETKKPERELVDHILAFAENPDEDILSMSPTDISSFLQEEGIDTSAGFRDLTKKMAAIKGQRRLADAKRKKELFAEQLARLTMKPKDALTNVREEIAGRLQSIDQSEVALVYFRKLEGATDSDLEGILDDLRLLDEFAGGGQE
jgi:hypothetical protein